MNIITIDWETYFDNDYTLSKMTTEEYVRDPRFEAHGFSIRWNEYPAARCQETIWYDGEMAQPGHVQCVLNQIDWSTTAILVHHAQFDGLILSHHYGIVPAMYLDTLSMARALLGTHVSKSLESLAREFGLGAKTVPYDLFKGKHWHELAGSVRDQVGRGACDDVNLTWDLFCRLAGSFPTEEYPLVDATVRMFTVPRLVGDTALLGEIWKKEEAYKRKLLAELEVTEADIRKEWVFAKLLREHGVEPDQKRMKDGKCKPCGGTGYREDTNECEACKGTGAEIRWKYAFAKTDDFMRGLEDDEDEDVRLLAEAKLAAHSTGTQTRTMRLGWMSTRGNLPVYLNYCGAHTKRWSGGDKVNWQNLKRGGPIADAVQAPAGCKLVAVDASQIECRLVNMVAGQEDVIEKFRNHEDIYVTVASEFCGFPVNKIDHPEERQAGKVIELLCGFGGGAKTVWLALKRAGIHVPESRGEDGKNAYRNTHPHVTALWREANDVLKKLHGGLSFEWRGCMVVQDKRIWMPNGLPLVFETLKWEDDPEDGGDAGWRVRVNKNGWSRMYGAKLIENVIQALARVHVSQAWLRCKTAGLDMVSMEHDKLIAIVRESDATAAFALMREEMSRPPVWLPNVPLDSEGYISDTFAKPEK